MENSKNVAGLVGPVMIAILASENQFVAPHLYDKQIPPVAYLSGTLFFLAGLAIVRAHNQWIADWPILITLTGWLAIFLGLFRMFAAEIYVQGAQGNPTVLLVAESIGLVVGIFLTYKAYWPAS